MSERALLPVGRDCECGHPLVWRDGKPWCSVYGAHQPVSPAELARVARVMRSHRQTTNTAPEVSPPAPSGRRAHPRPKRLRVVVAA